MPPQATPGILYYSNAVYQLFPFEPPRFTENFRISNNGTFELEVLHTMPQSVVLQASGDLTNWVDLACYTYSGPDVGLSSHIVTNSPAPDRRFYRLRVAGP